MLPGSYNILYSLPNASQVEYDSSMSVVRYHFPLAVGALLVSIGWWFWSFTQTDPNLYFSSTQPWVSFQQMMWSTPRLTIFWSYVFLLIASFALYLIAVQATFIQNQKKTLLFLGSVALGIMLLSNPALSHDLYNYMFNAKAIAFYHQDPHVVSALEIAPNDEWVRFMHNVHTTAPYGHFWTYATLVPYYLGFGKFISTFLAFKLFMALGFGALLWIQWKMLEEKTRILLFLLNPLVLIESLSSGHNDVWMMVLALVSFALILQTKKLISIKTVLSLVFLLVSTQIKEATLVLFPLWVLLIAVQSKLLVKIPTILARLAQESRAYWAEIAVALLFLPLFTSRSQQFNPWYLIWALSFLPFVRVRAVKIGLIVFSLMSLLRYLPFLFVGEYTDAIQLQMRVITWSAIPLTVLTWIAVQRIYKK